MAMTEGAIVINSSTGAATVKTGCAGEVFDAMDASQDYGGTDVSNPAAYAAAREQIAVLARAVAKVIPHIVNNAEVSTTVASGITVSVDPNTGTGSTTGSGSGTGTVA